MIKCINITALSLNRFPIDGLYFDIFLMLQSSMSTLSSGSFSLLVDLAIKFFNLRLQFN